MTPAQEALVHKNIGWARKVSARYTTIDRDDRNQEAMLSLCLAATKYDPGVGANFRGFAIHIIRNRMNAYYNKGNRQGFPVDWQEVEGGSEETAGYVMYLAKLDSDFDRRNNKAETMDVIRQVFTEPEEKRILVMLLRGWNQQDIADKWGTSQSSISRKVRRMRRKLRPFIPRLQGMIGAK